MKTTIIALFAAQAAAVAIRSEIPSPIDPNATIHVDRRSLLNNRAVCNADNLLRNLRDKRYSASASQFCSTYIQSTVVNTEYAVATEHVDATTTLDPVTITETSVVDKTSATSTFTISTTVTLSDSRANKRDAGSYPTWLPATYAPDRVSSACSCFIPSPSPAIQQTVTSTTSTDVLFSTETIVPDATTVTETSTNTVLNVATETAVTRLTCNIRGCIWGGSQYLGDLSVNSRAACKAACVARPGCKAYDYGIDAGNTFCVLGSAGAAEWWASPYCPYRVSDVGCDVSLE